MKCKITIIASICILIAGCCPAIKPAVIPSGNNISLTIGGKTILDFNPESHQLGFNEAKKEFRVSDDSFGSYFVLQCVEMPSKEGEDISATLIYTDSGKTAVIKKETFNVYSIDEGMVHLWNQEKQIMAIVKTLQ